MDLCSEQLEMASPHKSVVAAHVAMRICWLQPVGLCHSTAESIIHSRIEVDVVSSAPTCTARKVLRHNQVPVAGQTPAHNEFDGCYTRVMP